MLKETKCENTFVENQVGLNQHDAFPGESHHVESGCTFMCKDTSGIIHMVGEKFRPLVRLHLTPSEGNETQIRTRAPGDRLHWCHTRVQKIFVNWRKFRIVLSLHFYKQNRAQVQAIYEFGV